MVEFFDKVKLLRISENIENQIRMAILEKRLGVGSRLPSEHELSKVFGTSRSTVREALRTLERDGFIEIRQGMKGGSYVREANVFPLVRFVDHMLQSKKITLESLTEARLIIEPEIAKLAAVRSTDHDIERLKVALEDLRQVLEEERRDTATNINFHRIIGESCKNPVIHLLNHTFMTLLQENLSHLHIELSKNRLMLQQHTQIYEAIKARDPDRAYTELRNHIIAVKKVMKISLESENKIARIRPHE